VGVIVHHVVGQIIVLIVQLAIAALYVYRIITFHALGHRTLRDDALVSLAATVIAAALLALGGFYRDLF
jgi:hypothetical protein